MSVLFLQGVVGMSLPFLVSFRGSAHTDLQCLLVRQESGRPSSISGAASYEPCEAVSDRFPGACSLVRITTEMRVPLEWLKDYVAIRLSPEALAERLTMGGFEVTGIERTDGEPVFHFEITPNRADCLSVIGIAREIAALTGAKLKVRSSKFEVRRLLRTSTLKLRTSLAIRIEDREGCRRYLGRLIGGVTIGPSPEWMQRRLLACGVRPINNVVDITNYVLLEYGQPLHAFDYDRLADGTIFVGRARAGETLVMIDGQARPLSSEMLVIADAKRAVAVAGVMGGRETEITPATKRIVLESAWFEPTLVRRTGRALGVSTESSYRFERGVDPQGVATASRRAAQLILELTGGRETTVLDVGKRAVKRVVIRLEPDRMQRWLGVDVTPAQIRRACQGIGASVRRRATAWEVSVPSFRRDLKQDVDLVEEIARLIGYDRLPETIPSAPIASPRVESRSSYDETQHLRELAASLGLWEVMTWSLVKEAELASAHAASGQMGLANPLSRDHAVLRTTLLVGMLHVLARNYAQGASGARLFELGKIFERPMESAMTASPERLYLGIAVSGVWEQHWQGRREADLFLAKGVVEQFCARTSDLPCRVEADPSLRWAEPGTGMRVLLGPKRLGALGQVGHRVCQAFDLKKPVWFSELDVEILSAPSTRTAQVQAPSVFPPVKRDLSVLVDKTVEYATLLHLIQRVGAPLASHIELIDRYAGPQVPPTKHSLTFSIDYRDPSRTLTSEEVDAVHQRIGHELVQHLGAQLR